VTNGAQFTFAAVAQPVAARGWRPFPGLQTSKVPAMPGWSGLNMAEWDDADLAAAITEFQPADLYCCCLAVQPEIVAIDADIINLEHAAFASELADKILGKTPLVRIGFAPKQVRVYRAGDAIKSRKLHPLEIFCGSGQFIGFGWHEKAGRPYLWPHESPLTITADDHNIPAVKRAQLERFTAELFKTVLRRLLSTKQSRSGCAPGASRKRCMNTRSSQRPNLCPTSRKYATRSKPSRSWKRIEASFAASIPPIITCFPSAIARGNRASINRLPTPWPRTSCRT
jgi:hypothetical protein